MDCSDISYMILSKVRFRNGNGSYANLYCHLKNDIEKARSDTPDNLMQVASSCHQSQS